MSGKIVPSRLLANGSLELTVSGEVREADRFAWVFGIGFGGVGDGDVVDNGNATTTNGSRPNGGSGGGGGTGSPIAAQATSGVGRAQASVYCCSPTAMAMAFLGMLRVAFAW